MKRFLDLLLGFAREASRAAVRLLEKAEPKRRAIVDGVFTWRVHDVDGTLLREWAVPNAWPTAALNDLLGVYFASGTQHTAWYMGLIDNTSFSALASADTMSSHGGWIENTGYGAATRPAVSFSGASGGQMTTASPVTFTANTSIAIKAAFLTTDNTKGGTAGILGPTGLLGSVQSLTNGQTLSLNYTAPFTAT